MLPLPPKKPFLGEQAYAPTAMMSAVGPSPLDYDGSGGGGQRQSQNTPSPLWMDVSSAVQPQARKGATHTPRSGLHTMLFFAAITIVVGGVGMISISIWGPEKTSSGSSHLASNPPPPQVLPSLPASADVPTDPAAASAAPVSTEAAPADSSGKKNKKGQRGAPKIGGGKKR
jgi:hypothetical protein